MEGLEAYSEETGKRSRPHKALQRLLIKIIIDSKWCLSHDTPREQINFAVDSS
jgi:hypothetical protein